MSKFLTAFLVLAICTGLALLALSAWRRRRKEQSIKFSAPAEVLGGDTLANAWVQYVATTFLGDPLNRVTAYGLGFRGRADIRVCTTGLVIERKGERHLAIGNEQILGLVYEQATIDRVVEKDGLLAISWKQDSTELTTFLRFNSAADRNRILGASKVLARKAN
ncbi:MAG: hypothetical protein RLZ28_1003 [Actinomycetota bacterium]|jgi:hypothetical protein